MTVGTISRRSGLNRSTIHGKKHDLAQILAPCADRILDEWRKSPVKAADEATWPCNGVPGYVYGFFAKNCALNLRHGDPVGILAEALKAYKPKFTHGMSTVERQKAKDVTDHFLGRPVKNERRVRRISISAER